MCADPVTIGITLAVGSKVVKAIGQKKRSDANKRAAERAALADRRALIARQAEETIALLRGKGETERELEQIKSTILTQAAEANVSGLSVELLEKDIEREEGEIASAVAENIEMLRRQTSRQLRGVEAELESRIAAVPGPNLLALGLDIASGVHRGLETRSQLAFENKEVDVSTASEGGVNA